MTALRTLPLQKVILIAGLAAICGFFVLRGTLVPDDQTKVEREVRRIIKAAEKKDADAILDMLDDDFILELRDGGTYDAAFVRQQLGTYLRYYTIWSVRFETLTVEVAGDRAVAHLRTRIRGSAPNEGTGTHHGEWQAVFSRRDKTWMLTRFKVLGDPIRW